MKHVMSQANISKPDSIETELFWLWLVQSMSNSSQHNHRSI